MLNYSPLPYLFELAALVFVFWSMLRRHAGNQLDSWLLGWAFLLLHFTARLLDVSDGVWGTGIATISVLTLDLAGLVFIRAASRLDLLPAHRACLVPWAAALMAYSALVIWSVEAALPYYIAVTVMAASSSLLNYRVRSRRSGRDNVFSHLTALLLPLLLAGLIPGHQMGYGIDVTLSWIYLMAGIRYWQRFEEKTPGVMTAVFGFVVWATIFPVGLLIQQTYVPHLKINSDIRNLPKIVVAIGILLTFLEKQLERTEHLALHDALTGLPNRRLLEDRLEKALQRAERNRSRAAVLIVDLDGFKQINDNYGHAAGDAILRASALRLQALVRKADTIARTGGDEFTILVSDMTQACGADMLAQKLREELDRRIIIGTLQLRVMGSIGIAIYPDDAQTVADLCALADASMYEMKRRSKSTYPLSSKIQSSAMVKEILNAGSYLMR